MSELVDRIKNHQVWTELATIGTTFDEVEAREDNEPTTISSLQRIRAVLNLAKNRLDSADPYFVNPAALAAIAASITNIRQAAQAYLSDHNHKHINRSAIQHSDEILSTLAAISTPQTPDDLRFLSDSAATYRKDLEQHQNEAITLQRTLKAEFDASQKKLTQLTEAITAEQQKLSTLISEHQSLFSTAQDGRATEFNNAQSERSTAFSTAQNERQGQFSAVATENQSAFTAAQDSRANEYTEAENIRKTQSAALVADYTEKLAAQNVQFDKDREAASKQAQEFLLALKNSSQADALDILKALHEKKVEVENLVGVIGNLSVTSGYLRAANGARLSMYAWQLLTVVALVFLVFIGYSIAFPTKPNASNIAAQVSAITAPPTTPENVATNEKSSTPEKTSTQKRTYAPSPELTNTIQANSDSQFWQGLATRLFLAIALGVLAAYAARQGDKAQETERRNRKSALELEAVGPFIAPLPLPMREKFIMDLGERSFGVPDGELTKRAGTSPATPADLVRELFQSKEFQKLITDALKKAAPD